MRAQRDTSWGRWLGAHVTLLAYAAALSMPAHADEPAQVRFELPVEPRAEYDADHWFEDWFSTAKAELPGLPGELANDLAESNAVVAGLLREGIVVDDTVIVMGGPDAIRIFDEHAAQLGIHLRDSVMLVPELEASRKHFAEAHEDTLRSTASLRAETRTRVARVFDDNARIQRETEETVERITHDSAMRTEQSLKDAKTSLALGRERAWKGSAAAIDGAQDRLQEARDDGKSAAVNLHRGGLEGTGALARFTLTAPGERAAITREALSLSTEETRRELAARREIAVRETSDAVSWTMDAVDAAQRSGDERRRELRTELGEKGRESAQTHAQQREDIVHGVLSEVRPSANKAWADASVERARQHDIGYRQYLTSGLRFAGDNYFAGDVEGVLVGNLYTVSSVTQGVGFILVLAPMAYTSTLGAGALRTGAIAAKGGALLGMVDGLRVLTLVGGMMGAVAMMAGTAMLAQAQVAGALLAGTSRTALTAALLHGSVVGTALLGTAQLIGMAGAGAFLVGAAALLGAFSTIAWSTVGVGTGYLALGAATGARTMTALAYGALGSTGAVALATGIALASTSNALVRVAGDAAWSALARAVIPAVGVARMGVGLSSLGALATLNALAIPAHASIAMARAGVLSTGEFVRDPVMALAHLVAGAGGIGFRLVTVGGIALGVGVTRVALNLLKNAAKVTHYSMLGAIGGTLTSFEHVTAPFRFDKQIAWRRERQPQLEAMLEAQPDDVRARVGTTVDYLRVEFMGLDRGYVKFFDTEHNGKQWRFFRTVQADCEVVYENPELTLHSNTTDAACIRKHKEGAQ